MSGKSGIDHGRSGCAEFIGLTTVFSNPNIEAYEIVCYNPDDFQYIKEFLVPAEK